MKSYSYTIKIAGNTRHRKIVKCIYQILESARAELNNYYDEFFVSQNVFVNKNTISENFHITNRNVTFDNSLFVNKKFFINTNENSDEYSNDNIYFLNPFLFTIANYNNINYFHNINPHTCKYSVFRSRYTITHIRTFTIEYKIKV